MNSECATSTPLKNWWDAFPKEQSKPEQQSLEEVLRLREEGQAVVVDVRTDEEFAVCLFRITSDSG